MISFLEAFVLKVKRAETPFYRRLRTMAKNVATCTLPLPGFLHPGLRACFYLNHAAAQGLRRFIVYVYFEPLFRGRCISVGKRFRLGQMPYVIGHARIHIGDDVNFFGKVDIFSGRIFDHPTLVIKNRVDIGHNVSFVVNKEIVIEEDVNVAGGVRFMDTDAHPKDTAARIADLPPAPEEIKPVRVCRNSWIGQNSFILKGVTIGEGAVIGVGSVVVTDIPPYSVAMGNPARVVVKNLRKVAEERA